MPDHEIPYSTTEGLPVAPSLGPTLEAAQIPHQPAGLGPRIFVLLGLSVLIASVAALAAQGLTALIGLITNLAFYQKFSGRFVSPADHRLGPLVILVPVVGGLIIGLMAKYGSKAIRGHGIPEAMEQVLFNQSRIPPRLTFLKPLSAALSIGTGGPFGAEGPIIATGGAFGSLLGQVMKTSADERKTLLAAGAAAGMAATFGSPVSAVLLAIELLLFEYRARSFVPVAMASTVAAGIRISFVGTGAVFAMPNLSAPGGAAIVAYIALGLLVGLIAVGVTRAVYALEDAFERLPLHWALWPALGGLAVGIIGYFEPRTMGVGYDNIENILAGSFSGWMLLSLCLLKFLSWSLALSSGTSGGTLAPLFTFGGGVGALIGAAVAVALPAAGVDPRMAALVGMASIFAGASQALLASVIFAFETTLQPFSLLPLLGGCSMAYLTCRMLMRNSIMTEKIARRGLPVIAEYSADLLASTLVRDYASRQVVSLRSAQTLGEVREWMESGAPGSDHGGFPVLDERSHLVGVVTQKDINRSDLASGTPIRDLISRRPVLLWEDNTIRDAVDLMVRERVGRLPVLRRAANNSELAGILTRSDLLAAYGARLEETQHRQRALRVDFEAWTRMRAARP
jgi:H+/Cl- antiporter ClcA/predicted transcriptional regulator